MQQSTKYSLSLGCFLVATLAAMTVAIAGAKEIPESALNQSAFTKVVLATNLVEPMNLSVAGDGRVYLVEQLGSAQGLGTPIRGNENPRHAQDFHRFREQPARHRAGPGVSAQSLALSFYSPIEPEENQVSRFTLEGDSLDLSSEKILLHFHTDRKVANHAGGDLAFDRSGNLYASTGDNTFITENDSFAPIDERPGREYWDAQRSSANTMDLRGKILRIHPEPDGTYTIPRGNLFPVGSRGRPEIYVMGVRNPFRFTIDDKTGWLYWGDVGPDAPLPSESRGPAGFDEFNQARKAGNFGWPQFSGDNKPYRRYDFATKQSGEWFDATHPMNLSPNNTGAKELPPAQPAIIWYPYSFSARFPEMGSGARAAMSGPVYHFDKGLKSTRKLPAYYDGALFVFDWERSWIQAVHFDDSGKLKRIEPFLPAMKFKRPICIKTGPDGALYVIEWGSNWVL